MSISCHGRRRPCAASASRAGVGRMGRGPAPNALVFVAALILWGALFYVSRPPLIWSNRPQICQSAGLAAPCVERSASSPPSALASPL